MYTQIRIKDNESSIRVIKKEDFSFDNSINQNIHHHKREKIVKLQFWLF